MMRSRFLLFGILLFTSCCFQSSSANVNNRKDSPNSRRVFKIVFYYDDVFEHVEDLVNYAVDSINRILKASTFSFDPIIHRVEVHKSYQLITNLCNELSDGRIAVVGIGESPVFQQIYSITKSLRVPYFSIRWENQEEEEKEFLQSLGLTASSLDSNSNHPHRHPHQHPGMPLFQSHRINLHPPANKLMKGVIDLITHYKWEYVTILYQESNNGLNRIEDLIKLSRRLGSGSTAGGHSSMNKQGSSQMGSGNSATSKMRVQVRQLSSDINKWIFLIKDVKLSGSSHIIVDIQTKYLNKFLEQAEQVGLMTSYFHFIFTSLDLSVLDYAPFANITALQVFEPNDTNVRSLFAEFNLKNMVSHKPMFKYMPSEAIFIYDALSVLANTIDRQNLVEQQMPSPIVSCDKETPWSFGNEFIKMLKMTNFNGLSGHIEFDPASGFRTNVTLAIVDKTKTGVDLVGYWREFNNKKPIEIVRSYAKEKDQVLDKLNRNLIVTTKLEAPYVMKRESINNETLRGNQKYKGYCVDLLEKISKICGFNYTIKLVEDGLHGSYVNGKWNGIVNELIEKKADLAVAGLTITFQRDQVIDFTKPFLNLGISILYKRPQKKTPNLFSFMSPLSFEIWLYMIAAYLVVSFMLFVLARFSPYEWQNPHPCKPDSGLVQNQFTVLNSLWFTIGSLMQQGTEINPLAPSVRLISCVWSFFTLILVSSYTANLAAFLTVQRMQNPIENADDLSRQTEIKYGPVKSGSTENFFKESKIQTYERMWNFMSSNPDVFVKSTEEGIERVKKGNYAYLVESTTNEYVRQRDCELMQVGGLIDTKGYGIGTPTGSPWRDQISNAILQLQEKGDLQELFTKWWEIEGKDPNQKCDFSDDKKKDSANELSLANVGGVFVVLAVGLCLSFLVAFLEFLWKARQPSNDQMNLKERIVRDLRFAFCSQKARKRSFSFSTFYLTDSLKLVAASESNADANQDYRLVQQDSYEERLLVEDKLKVSDKQQSSKSIAKHEPTNTNLELDDSDSYHVESSTANRLKKNIISDNSIKSSGIYKK